MKTYTLTWRSDRWNKPNSLCRVRINCSDPLEIFMYQIFDDGQVQHLLTATRPRCHRLIKCGKLVAREATYQGV